MFGIKLPSEQVTGWGLVILIGVQLYLVMYLKQLSNKLTPDDPGWHMPWMAMDQSLLARALLFLTVVVLPSSAGLLVSIRATRQIVPNGLKWKIIETFRSISVPDRIELALMILGFVVCVTLSIVCWKYRPKLNDPKAPAELFE